MLLLYIRTIYSNLQIFKFRFHIYSSLQIFISKFHIYSILQSDFYFHVKNIYSSLQTLNFHVYRQCSNIYISLLFIYLLTLLIYIETIHRIYTNHVFKISFQFKTPVPWTTDWKFPLRSLNFIIFFISDYIEYPLFVPASVKRCSEHISQFQVYFYHYLFIYVFHLISHHKIFDNGPVLYFNRKFALFISNSFYRHTFLCLYGFLKNFYYILFILFVYVVPSTSYKNKIQGCF